MNDTVQLWQVPLTVPDEVRARYFVCLSDDEKLKAQRFRFERDRTHFIVARGTLRHMLGIQFARSPQSVQFCYGEYGKPSIIPTASSADSPCDFHFNLSHSGELALCVLGGQRLVGVDVEVVRPIDRLDGMMSRCLGEWEREKVAIAPNPTQSFLQHWTCKEAYLKAIGKGLSQSMQSIEVQLAPPYLLKVPEDCAEGWNLHMAELPADYTTDYVGALVVSGHVRVDVKPWLHDAIWNGRSFATQ